jgi:hypothetical protein
MFGWLKRRIHRNRAEGRTVFAYRDETGKVRYADPLVAWQEFEAATGTAGEDWGGMFKILGASMPPKIEGMPSTDAIEKDLRRKQAGAAAVLADAASRALGIPPLAPDGSGMTRAERIKLASNFLAFMGRLADAARPFAKSPPPTAASPPV